MASFERPGPICTLVESTGGVIIWSTAALSDHTYQVPRPVNDSPLPSCRAVPFQLSRLRWLGTLVSLQLAMGIGCDPLPGPGTVSFPPVCGARGTERARARRALRQGVMLQFTREVCARGNIVADCVHIGRTGRKNHNSLALPTGAKAGDVRATLRGAAAFLIAYG